MVRVTQSSKQPLQVALILLGIAIVVGVLVWQGVTSSGNPDPTAAHIGQSAAVLDTAVLVFREGLECVVALAALTASFVDRNQPFRRPVAFGAGLGFFATILTWFLAVAILSSINAPALDIQAATGLLAIVILMVVMNWFFHKVYWTGWLSMHSRRRRELVAQEDTNEPEAGNPTSNATKIFRGLALLGFASVYREGFEVVLFLQSIRLQVGTETVLVGAALGVLFASIFGVLTLIANQRLPYKQMLIASGILLGVVLVVMVGENIQEMQQAAWIGTTLLPLSIPAWMGVWFAVFPNVEGIVSQCLAALFVIGSYLAAEYVRIWRPRRQRAQSLA